jgi:hypothetical protein
MRRMHQAVPADDQVCRYNHGYATPQGAPFDHRTTRRHVITPTYPQLPEALLLYGLRSS